MLGSKNVKYIILLNTLHFQDDAFLVGINESTFTCIFHENYVAEVKNALVKHVFIAWRTTFCTAFFKNVRVDKLTVPHIYYERTDRHSSLSPISFTSFLLALYFVWELFEIFQSARRHSPKPHQILMSRATTANSDGAETNHSLRYRWKTNQPVCC
jgi:hypothetical protein